MLSNWDLFRAAFTCRCCLYDWVAMVLRKSVLLPVCSDLSVRAPVRSALTFTLPTRNYIASASSPPLLFSLLTHDHPPVQLLRFSKATSN
jgi:hypothetical protein